MIDRPYPALDGSFDMTVIARHLVGEKVWCCLPCLGGHKHSLVLTVQKRRGCTYSVPDGVS
jgi:hypothetical protein